MNEVMTKPRQKMPLTKEEWGWLSMITVGAIAFYLPFLARQFQGDDWLWLYNAKLAMDDPSVIVGRPMYGYFRPLNMLIVMGLSKLFGTSASAFSVVSMLLHAANSAMIWMVLREFGAELRIRNIAAIFFAFYFLNCSALAWLSVAHDLWVMLLCLLVIQRTCRAVETPSSWLFAQIWLLAATATLIKESGFVALGLYFAVLWFQSRSPLRKPYLWFSVFFALSFVAYLTGYSMTRTFVDRDVSVGLAAFTNLWYFLAYMIFPIPERVVTVFPESLLWVLKALRIIITVALPIVAVYLWVKGGAICRTFLAWSVMFIGTFAILNWDIALFSLYSPRSVGRFMYLPIAGLAVCFAWLWVREIESRLRFLSSRIVVSILAAVFVVGNFGAVQAASRLYFSNQDQIERLREDVQTYKADIMSADSVVILTDDREAALAGISSEKHLRAIIYVDLDKLVEVGIRESKAPTDGNSKTTYLGWDLQRKRLVAVP